MYILPGKLVDYVEAYKMLGAYEIKAAEAKYVSSAKEAIEFSHGGEPLAMKVISEKALHKSKSGLVRLGLSKPADIEGAFEDLSAKAQKIKPYKILVQKMVKGDKEIIVGSKTDEQFGKLILVGLGGIYVETFKDVAIRVCPINEYDANEMLDQLKSGKIIAPDEQSRKMLTNLLLKVSKFILDHKEIEELDLNPVIIYEGGYCAVDLRLMR